ncbi:hypothetical protein [Amycolatopsis pretoriensis]|uniref:hypothetical protein n=1 Tax=Amycolatopsis pretoriensis TaxID=218821 RepID=UPI00115F9F6F|nr:hypothetical protein [Amycolatopsis pretoriensis]
MVQALKWTGSNSAEVTTFAGHCGFTAVDNGDGTITTSGACRTGTDLPAGTWLNPLRATASTEAELAEYFQEVGRAPRCEPLQGAATSDKADRCTARVPPNAPSDQAYRPMVVRHPAGGSAPAGCARVQ